jgi:antitoxin component of MazEF toxin-antitoxin module
LPAAVDFFQKCAILSIDNLYKGGAEKMEMRKVFKSGNSLVVSLPKEVVNTLSIREGQHLTFEVKGKGVLVKPQRKPRNMETLKKLFGCLTGQDEITDRMLRLRDEDDREVESFE